MISDDISHRLTVVEVKVENLKAAIEEEKEETREHRERINDKLDTLVRLVFVGVGILITLQFLAPVLLRAWKIGQ